MRHVNPPTLPTPNGYTHVVLPAPGDRLVFIAGQVAADRTGAIVGARDFRAQTVQVFENLKAACEAAGGSIASIFKITVYVTDLSQVAALREVRQEYFREHPPASTLVQVAGLARPEYMIEIEAVAALT